MSTEGDARWMCQWGTQRDPGLAEAALGAQVYDLGQEALNSGLLGQDAYPVPRRTFFCNVLQVFP